MLSRLVSLGLLLAIAASAQVAARRPSIRTTGEALISSRPDQVRVGLGVITDAASAQESVDENASRAAAVLAAVRTAAGAGAEVRTVAYSVRANYRFPPNAAPLLTGYTTTNVVEVTLSDITGVGRIIDAGTQAGANSVQSLRFLLKDAAPVKAQALRQAAQQARVNAEAIASGLSGRLGAVVSAEESSSVRAISAPDARLAAGAATPIEAGTVDVVASVTLEIELNQ